MQADSDDQTTTIGGNFSLVSHTGKTFSLRQVRGQIAMIFFGFTHCPDVCPNTLAVMNAVMVNLGPQAEHVTPIFISLDPKRDSPEVLANYLSYFDADFIGLTGSKAEIDRVTSQYKVFYRLIGDTNNLRYRVDHSTNLYIVDKRGRLVRIIPYGMPHTEVLNTVRELLKPSE